MLGVRNHAREHGTMLRRAWRKLYEGWSVADSRDLSILLRLLRSALGDDFRKKLPDCGGSGDSAESGRSAGDSAGFNGMGCRSDSGGVCNGHCRRKQGTDRKRGCMDPACIRRTGGCRAMHGSVCDSACIVASLFGGMACSVSLEEMWKEHLCDSGERGGTNGVSVCAGAAACLCAVVGLTVGRNVCGKSRKNPKGYAWECNDRNGSFDADNDAFDLIAHLYGSIFIRQKRTVG